MLTKEFTNKFVEEGITREIQVKKGEIVLITFKKDKDSNCYENIYTYPYIMYTMFNSILTIVTCKGETVVFNIKLCRVIVNIPKFVEVKYYNIVNQTFIKIVEGEKQSIYDERSNLLGTETEYDIEVIFGGRYPVIKKTDKQTGKSHYVEFTLNISDESASL